ncbi:hypothetical protein C2S51_032968 [Perilla frutescens var. frutescens]|nr:hypothetical protein C2S51_032968 [Perilla frutescens var. frutescens]
MYPREKLCRDQNYKSRKSDRTNPPSFSSSLLDEIYRSIDGNADKSDDFKAYKEKSSRRQGGGGGGGGCYEEIASFRRVEKWMEKEANEKSAAQKRQQFLQDSDNKPLHDNDLIFFSSTSSSSDSSGALSSSDTEFFASTARSRPKVSCFTARPKPVRTGSNKDQEPFFKSDDDDRKIRDGIRAVDDDLIKSKSRALKIYANLKKVKQPISPGGRLTTFINSLFSNASGKKSRNPDAAAAASGFRDVKSPAGRHPPSACSSASSFSRSCLSKYSPRSREKMRDGPRRTVRFEPVSVIVDGDLRPCGEKSIYDDDDDSGRFVGLPPLPPPSGLAGLKLNKKVERVTHDCVLKGYTNTNTNTNNNDKRNGVFFNEDEDEEDDDDCLSDSSSDLFELDHLALFGSNRFSEELPVYETTHFDTNCAIASGLIR